MADKKESDKPKKVSKLAPKKKQLTVRERAAEASKEKPKRIRKAASKATAPFSRARKIGKKEYHMPLPDNKTGRILKKRVRIIPKFVREAFREVRLVEWPDRKTTIKLTLAVFIFALIFALFVGLLDYIFGEIFKKIFVNK